MLGRCRCGVVARVCCEGGKEGVVEQSCARSRHFTLKRTALESVLQKKFRLQFGSSFARSDRCTRTELQLTQSRVSRSLGGASPLRPRTNYSIYLGVAISRCKRRSTQMHAPMPFTNSREQAKLLRAASATRLRRESAGRPQSMAGQYMTRPGSGAWGSRGLRLTPPWVSAGDQGRQTELFPDLTGSRDDLGASLSQLSSLPKSPSRLARTTSAASTHELSAAGFGRPAAALRHTLSGSTSHLVRSTSSGSIAGLKFADRPSTSALKFTSNNLRPSTARNEYALRPTPFGDFLETVDSQGSQTSDVTFGGPRVTFEMRRPRGSHAHAHG